MVDSTAESFANSICETLFAFPWDNEERLKQHDVKLQAQVEKMQEWLDGKGDGHKKKVAFCQAMQLKMNRKAVMAPDEVCDYLDETHKLLSQKGDPTQIIEALLHRSSSMSVPHLFHKKKQYGGFCFPTGRDASIEGLNMVQIANKDEQHIPRLAWCWINYDIYLIGIPLFSLTSDWKKQVADKFQSADVRKKCMEGLSLKILRVEAPNVDSLSKKKKGSKAQVEDDDDDFYYKSGGKASSSKESKDEPYTSFQHGVGPCRYHTLDDGYHKIRFLRHPNDVLNTIEMQSKRKADDEDEPEIPLSTLFFKRADLYGYKDLHQVAVPQVEDDD